MKCRSCGTEFDEGIFCPECGTKYEDVSNSTEHSLVKTEVEKISNSVVDENSLSDKEPKKKTDFMPQKKNNENEKNSHFKGINENQKSVPSKSNSLEIVSLIFGIISLLTCGSLLFPGIIAIVCAKKSQINGEMSDKAKIGMKCGIGGLAIFCVGLILSIIIVVLGS